jgi:precorrin-6B methylase 2
MDVGFASTEHRHDGIRTWQPYVLLALAEQAGCELFVDVGANIGAYSLFASLIPTVSRIVAYEANPHAADQLRVNAS